MLQLRAGGDLVQGPVSKSHSVLSLAGLMSESTNGLELHPLVTSLAEQIRTCRTALPDLSPLAVDPALEAISGMLDGETLFIRNELHQCLGLRKLHLEIARLGMGLQILHCVFFPDPRFDLPIFGADIVASKAGISAAIVDLSPVCDSLPDAVSQPLSALQLPPFQQVRDLPAWGTIFSPYVKFIRPELGDPGVIARLVKKPPDDMICAEWIPRDYFRVDCNGMIRSQVKAERQQSCIQASICFEALTHKGS